MEQQGDTVQNDYDGYVQDWKLQRISNAVVMYVSFIYDER